MNIRWRQEDGQTLVEFALVLPVLALVLFGIIQFGLAFKDSLAVTDAVRAGARQAAVSRLAADPVARTRQAVLDASGDLDSSKVGVTVTSTWQPGQDVTVTGTYPYRIDILGLVVDSGNITSSTTERVE